MRTLKGLCQVIAEGLQSSQRGIGPWIPSNYKCSDECVHFVI